MKTITEQEYLREHNKTSDAKQAELDKRNKVFVLMSKLGFYPTLTIFPDGNASICPKTHGLFTYDEAIEYMKLFSKIAKTNQHKVLRAINNDVHIPPIFIMDYEIGSNRHHYTIHFCGNITHRKTVQNIDLYINLSADAYNQFYKEFAPMEGRFPKTYPFSACSYTSCVSTESLNKWLHLKIGQHSLI